jgi:hypothetical protein
MINGSGANNLLTANSGGTSPAFRQNGNDGGPTSTSNGVTVASVGAITMGSSSAGSARDNTSDNGGAGMGMFNKNIESGNGDRFKRTDERVVISALARLEQDSKSSRPVLVDYCTGTIPTLCCHFNM